MNSPLDGTATDTAGLSITLSDDSPRHHRLCFRSYHQPTTTLPANMEARGINDPPGPDAWFRNLPIVTRFWFGSSVVVTLGVNFGIISGYLIPFAWENVKSKFELWRLLSCFLYVGPVSVSDSSAVVALSVCLFSPYPLNFLNSPLSVQRTVQLWNPRISSLALPI